MLPAVSGRRATVPRRGGAGARGGAAGGAWRCEALAELRAQRAAMGGPAGRAAAGPGGHGGGKGQEGKRNLGGQKLGWMIWFGRFSGISCFFFCLCQFFSCIRYGIVMPSQLADVGGELDAYIV